MEWFNYIYTFLIFSGLFATLGISYYVFYTHKTSAARSFIIVAIIVSFWLAGSGFSAISPNEYWSEFWWYKIRFSMILIIGFFFLIFILRYTNKIEKLKKIHLILLGLPPAVLLILNITNDHHGLIAGNITFTQLGGIFLRTGWIPGPAYWFHSALILSYGLICFVLLANMVINTTGLQKKQAMFILISYIFPSFIGIPQSVMKLNWGWDFLGLAVALACITNGIAIFKYQMFSLTPIARNLLIEDMQDSVIVIDAEEKIIDFNPAAKKLFDNYTSIFGTPIKNLIPGLFNENDLTSFVTKKTVNLASGNEVVPYDMNISPIKNQKSELLGHIIVMRNISELQGLISELDAYARTVAHDLKNPVNTLRWYIELSQKALETKDQKDVAIFLNSMSNLSKNMNTIVDELLLFAGLRKVEAADLSSLDMKIIIDNVVNRLSELIDKRKARVIFNNHCPKIISYPQWIEEVLSNYINNAIKFGGTPPIVEVGAEELLDGRMKIYVRDNGKGLSESEIEKLLDENETETKMAHLDGQALTLSIVKKIIKKLNGTTGIESVPGKGSTFYFVLPQFYNN